jgi:hypothetical protein
VWNNIFGKRREKIDTGFKECNSAEENQATREPSRHSHAKVDMRGDIYTPLINAQRGRHLGVRNTPRKTNLALQSTAQHHTQPSRAAFRKLNRRPDLYPWNGPVLTEDLHMGHSIQHFFFYCIP